MNKAYYSRWLKLPADRFNLPSLMNALTYPLKARDRITGYLHAYKQEAGFFLVPREFYDKKFLSRLNIDLELDLPKSYPKVNFKDAILLDAKDSKSSIQTKAFSAMKSATHGVLSLSCGRGKTVIALKYAALLSRPTLVIVETTGLVSQWAGEASKFLGLPDSQIGFIQGHPDKWTATRPFVIATIQSLSKYAEEVPKKIRNRFGLILWDECVEGSALIETDEGAVTMQEVASGKGSKALSYDKDGGWAYRSITRRWNSGERRTLIITTVSGLALRVTPEHLVREEEGWKRADELRVGMRILSPVRVGAESRYQPSANPESPGPTYAGMGEGSQSYPSPRENSASSTEPCWGTARFPTPTRESRHPDSPSTTARSRKSGYSSRQAGYRRCGCGSQRDQMAGTVRRTAEGTLSAIHSWLRSTTEYVRTAIKRLHENGWTASALRGSPGGTWTMDPPPKAAYASIPKDTAPLKSTSSASGWETSTTRPPLITTKVTSCCSTPSRAGCSLTGPGSSRAPRWSTSFETILGVYPSLTVDVYDIEVTGAHNFVANGLLVHNCHHLSAPHYNRTAALFPGLRIGLSATPERLDGLESLYLAHMGDIFYLDHSQDLVPEVEFHEVDLGVDWTSDSVLNEILDRTGELSWTRLWGYLGSHQKFLDEAVDLIKTEANRGRKILVLSNRLNTVSRIHYALEASKGGMSGLINSKTKQDERLNILRNKQVAVSISRIAREGLDEPSLDTLVMIEPTSDPNMLRQACGRILRTCSTKKQPRVHIMIARTDPCIRMMYIMRKNFRNWPRVPKMTFNR